MVKKFLKKYGWRYIPGILFLAINSSIQNLGPAALGDAIDFLKAGEKASVIIHQAWYIVWIALAVFVTKFVWRMFIIMNARYMEVFLRMELFKKLQKLPLSFFSGWHSGDLMAYAINDVGAVRLTFGPVIAQSLNGIITGVLAIVSMIATVSWKMTVLALIPVPIAIASIIIIGKMVQRQYSKVQRLFSSLSGFVNESIMGIRVIKTFAKEHQWYDNFDRNSNELNEANVKLVDISSLITPITLISFGISYAVSLILGGNGVMSGNIQLGDLVAFQGYLLLIQAPIVQLGRIVNRIQQGLASYKRLNAIYQAEEIPEFDRVSDGSVLKGDLEVRGLTFTYPGQNEPALKNVSFSIKAGQTLGLCGDTGCGKTTLLALLLKQYPVPEHTMFLDGRDVNTIPASAIRENTGYVPQDGFLFSCSVRDNIAFYEFGCTDQKVREAAELASIRSEIEALPEGFETQVGERGTHLSGGQKQRISLARALIRDPNILILDDTLSAVDNITEKAIVSHLEGILKAKTSLIVSHRLSAIQHADLILYLENGQILEQGTHQELMALNGRYAETYSMQQEEAHHEKA